MCSGTLFTALTLLLTIGAWGGSLLNSTIPTREVQTYHDPEIEVRLLEYNILASRQYDRLPVSSYVICLREEADVAEPPFIRHFLDEEGEEVHRFSYRVIRVWLIPTQVLLQTGRMGLLPLVTLTQGGKQPEVVNTMITRLAEAQEWDLLAISRLLGGFVFKKEAERERMVQKEVHDASRYSARLLGLSRDWTRVSRTRPRGRA